MTTGRSVKGRIPERDRAARRAFPGVGGRVREASFAAETVRAAPQPGIVFVGIARLGLATRFPREVNAIGPDGSRSSSISGIAGGGAVCRRRYDRPRLRARYARHAGDDQRRLSDWRNAETIFNAELRSREGGLAS